MFFSFVNQDMLISLFPANSMRGEARITPSEKLPTFISPQLAEAFQLP